jgi:hypothetical protein
LIEHQAALSGGRAIPGRPGGDGPVRNCNVDISEVTDYDDMPVFVAVGLSGVRRGGRSRRSA